MDGYRNMSELYSYMAFLKYYTHKLYTYIMGFEELWVTTVRGNKTLRDYIMLLCLKSSWNSWETQNMSLKLPFTFLIKKTKLL